jgi:hypothetical protein
VKKAAVGFISLALISFVLYSFSIIYKTFRLANKKEIAVLMVYHPALKSKYPHILQAYKSVLDEEGVPYEEINVYMLFSLNVEDIIKSKPAIVFPDTISQILPEELKTWVQSYLRKGGSIAVIYDAGTRTQKGAFFEKALFSDIVKINYITYSRLGKDAYTVGYVKMDHGESSDFFQIPPGKINDGLLLGGYAYGKLEYPIARNELLEGFNSEEIYASAITKDRQNFPALVMKNYGRGNVLYVNLPLGHLKAHSDDLPLRAILRTFLFRVVKIPHLLNTKYGKGGLIINWHIDANVDWKSIPLMLEKGYLREGVDYSIHITAGNFRDYPGDSLGFDACGKGEPFVRMMLKYGSIGSHGGWAHNWFSNNIVGDKFKEGQIYEYIRKNNECLQRITGYDIKEFSAPNGVHPQPIMTRALENLKILAYYYTGDTGSAPNRTFVNGKMISKEVIAFPIMPFGKSASLDEMKRSQKTEEEVRNWFFGNIDYVVKNRTVRLIYSHPYDILKYPSGLQSLLNYAEDSLNKGILEIKPMSYFAQFLLRFLKTQHQFELNDNNLIIKLTNPEGLEGITVAIPKHSYKKPFSSNLLVQEDDDYYYLSVKENNTERSLSCEIIKTY